MMKVDKLFISMKICGMNTPVHSEYVNKIKYILKNKKNICENIVEYIYIVCIYLLVWYAYDGA